MFIVWLSVVYVDELQKLQDGNAKLQSELREKDGQVAELSRQLRNAQGQLMQYSNAPNGQFKLTSELYASLVASEDKVAALEEENARLKVLQKQSLQVRYLTHEIRWVSLMFYSTDRPNFRRGAHRGA